MGHPAHPARVGDAAVKKTRYRLEFSFTGLFTAEIAENAGVKQYHQLVSRTPQASFQRLH
jgi:hypothetical protein